MKQNYFFNFISICLLILTVSDAFGREPELPVSSASTLMTMERLTLDDAIRLALENNPGLQAAAGRIESAEGQAIRASLWSNPELELFAEDFPQQSGGFSESKNMLGISQTVPFPGKKSLERRAGQMNVKATESEFAFRKLELIRDVKISFFRVLAAEKRLEITAELLKLADTFATTARKRVEAGAAPDQEQLRAEIEFERNRSELADLRREALQSRAELALLLKTPEVQKIPFVGNLVDSVSPTYAEEESSVFVDHPQIRAMQLARQQAELELRRAKLEPLPDVTVGIAGGRHEANNESLLEFRISIPLPIFDRGQGKIREAKGNLQVAAAEVAGVEQFLIKTVSSTKARLDAASQQVRTYKERILPKAEEALRMVQGGYQEGKFDFITLLDTQRTTAEARLAYQEKLLELNIAQAELDAVLINHKGQKQNQ